MSLGLFAFRIKKKMVRKKWSRIPFKVLQMVWRLLMSIYRECYKWYISLKHIKAFLPSLANCASLSSGLDHIDLVYFINLDRRKDRLKNITNELKKTNINPHKIHRISAFYEPHLGALGCSKSHCLALEKFLQSDPSNKTCLILEDDFKFKIHQKVIRYLLDKFFKDIPSFDVLMFSGNSISGTPTNKKYLTKVQSAVTASGYVVSREFAPTLLRNYKESVALLQQAGTPVPEYCLDMHWQELQPVSNWYSLNPLIGRQRNSYSDIEQREVAYGI